MGTMNCNAFLDQLEQWMEGDRSADAQSHLTACPQCRGVVDDLESIHQAAASMEAADPAPPEKIWLALRSQLEEDGLIHGEERTWAKVLTTWFGGVFSAVPRPALAGAYLVALIAVGVAMSGRSYTPIEGSQVSTQPLMAQLNTAEQDAVSSMMNSDPAVTASFHKNLAIVDNYIALCEKSVQQEPESEVARDYLYGAYQQKAELLARITERGDDR